MNSEQKTILEAALAYAERGWRVLLDSRPPRGVS